MSHTLEVPSIIVDLESRIVTQDKEILSLQASVTECRKRVENLNNLLARAILAIDALVKRKESDIIRLQEIAKDLMPHTAS